MWWGIATLGAIGVLAPAAQAFHNGPFTPHTGPMPTGLKDVRALPYADGAGGASGMATSADPNGDGQADLIGAAGDSRVNVFLGDGNGGFSSPVTSPFSCVSASQGRMSAGDVDGDGDEDLAIGCGDASSVKVMLGDGTGAYPTEVDVPLSGNYIYNTRIADLDGDGDGDLVAVGACSDTLEVVPNEGGGSFGAPVSYTVGAGGPQPGCPGSGAGFDASGLGVGDLNGDGRPELVVGNMVDTTLSVFVNDGSGSFAPQVKYAAPGMIPSQGEIYSNLQPVVVDIDGSGDPEVVVSSRLPGPGRYYVFPVNPDATLGTPHVHPSGGGPRSVAIGDFNGDGKLDLGAGTNGVNLLIATGNGDGTFHPQQTFGDGVFRGDEIFTDSSFGVDVGVLFGTSVDAEDYDGDGLSDIASIGTSGLIAGLSYLPEPFQLAGQSHEADVNVGQTFALGTLRDPTPEFTRQNQLRATIDWGDGSPADGVQLAATGPGDFSIEAAHTYATAGLKDVTITVEDEATPRTATTQVTVMVIGPPEAAFTWSPEQPQAESGVAFDGSGSTDEEEIASYDWDFGDGQTGSGVTPSHSYTAPGTYTVTLTVTDNRGLTDSVSHEVTVVERGRQGAFVCRASGLRLPLAGEPAVANPPADPCTPQERMVVPLDVPALAGARGLRSVTSQTPDDPASTPAADGDGATAESSVAKVAALSGPARIEATGVESRASATCEGGELKLRGESELASLTVGGRRVAVGDGRATVPLLLGTLHINKTTIEGGRIVQRAVWLQSPLGDIVIGEAIVGGTGAPCR